MAPHLLDWLSQELTERVTKGVDAHLGTQRHACVQEIVNESAHGALDALLDSDAFLEEFVTFSERSCAPKSRSCNP